MIWQIDFWLLVILIIAALIALQVRDLLAIKQGMGIGDARLDDGAACVLGGSDEFLRGFSTRAIPQHTADANGHGRGYGIAGQPSQNGQPQPTVPGSEGPPVQQFPSVVAGREIPAGSGASSATARRRAAADEVERLVQIITDKIVRGGQFGVGNAECGVRN